MNDPTVVLAGQRALFREAVAESLQCDHGIDVAVCTDDVNSTVLQADRLNADVVVICSSLAPSLPALGHRLRQLRNPPKLLVADSHPDQDALLDAIEAGADGYSSGASGMQGLADAIDAISRGESVVPPTMLGPLLRGLIERQRVAAQAAERLISLTPREREVLALLVDGLDQRSIAEVLVISPETVRTHLQRLLRKLEVRSRAEAVTLVARTGLRERLERIVEGSAS